MDCFHIWKGWRGGPVGVSPARDNSLFLHYLKKKKKKKNVHNAVRHFSCFFFFFFFFFFFHKIGLVFHAECFLWHLRRWHIGDIFLNFSQKIGFDSSWRQFAWNVKACFGGKNKKNVSKFCLMKFLTRLTAYQAFNVNKVIPFWNGQNV